MKFGILFIGSLLSLTSHADTSALITLMGAKAIATYERLLKESTDSKQDFTEAGRMISFSHTLEVGQALKNADSNGNEVVKAEIGPVTISCSIAYKGIGVDAKRVEKGSTCTIEIK